MTPLPHQLGQLLLRRGSINEQQLLQALALQAQEPQPIGQALISLGYLDEKTLKRTLRQQRWLRPCAACFAMIAPFSATYASPASDSDLPENWLQKSSWMIPTTQDHVGEDTRSVDLVKFAALTAWDIYQGTPEAGEMRFNLSQTSKGSYELQMTMHF